ncbi:MAG: HPr kinase/phosphatase C-terminal domain-containing protein [Marivibrio sp.]|uniref:HPr kinase/phosphorylase n=1 Tax=Marivibrio sp. TaxID=2039719 RepID=UPI0032ECC678
MSGRSGRKASRRDDGRDQDGGEGARAAPPSLVHATALAVRVDGGPGARATRDFGVLLRGPSGAGKSDLAFRMIEAGDARLIADDRTDLTLGPSGPILQAPPALAGRIELRGLGVAALRPEECAASAGLSLIVDLVPRAAVPRLPEPLRETVLGVAVPALRLHAFDVSTPAKIRRALALIASRETGADGADDDADADAIGPLVSGSAS